jgi:sulfopropanediol 3-dehydrogenase
MPITYLKKADLTSTSDSVDVRNTVQEILDTIEAGGDASAIEYAAKFDKYDGNIMLTAEEIEAAAAQVPEQLKKDIQFAHQNVRRFAEMQKTTMNDVEMEIVPGLIAGQKCPG